MDASVGIIKDSYPELYINYIISRKLVTPSTHPLAIRCKVVDEQNVPIAGVTATVTETGMVFKTKTKGGFSVKNFAVGTFQFTFARPGYVPQEVPFVVASGSRTDLTIVMVAV
jgi:Carboxypeptidase regulatory-like domain